MDTKKLTFAIMMGALGTALFAVSYTLAPIAPSLAFDFSLIGVFVAGYYGGPEIGFITGLFAGILPGVMFGPLGSGGIFGLIGLPFGKALTGMTAGLIAKGAKLGTNPHSWLLSIPSTFLAYVPEALFTWGYFVFLLQYTTGTAVFLTVLTKALIEIAIISVAMATLLANKGFNSYLSTHFKKRNVNKSA
jgi:hypothetical protein